MKLNKKQQLARKGFKDFLLNDSAFLYILEGYSGCGKTTLVRHLLDEAKHILNFVASISPTDPRKTIALTATTHQAAENLGNVIGSNTVTTYHSFMSFRITENHLNGTTSITPTRNTLELYNTILVIDEASYLVKEELDLIQQYMNKTNCKLVLIGDPCQLLGVGSKSAYAFTLDTEYHFYLDEIMRQQDGSLIMEFGEAHREAILNKATVLPEIIYDNKSIVLCNGEQYELTLKRLFTQDMRKQRILNFRNNKVIEDNLMIRDMLGYSSEGFQVGEFVSSNGLVTCEITNKPLIPNNAQCRVIERLEDDIVIFTHDSGLVVEIPCAIYTLRLLRSNTQVMCKVPLDLEDYQNTVAEIATMAENNRSLWGIYFKLKKYIADIRPTYASTVHKAQGLTLDYACVDIEDIDSVAERDIDMALRLRYVGVTRAAKVAYLYHPDA